jgi:hypothetical protein
MATAAAEALVAGSGLPNVERPFAVRLIADEIDNRFDALPAHLESWRSGQQTAMGDRSVDDPQQYGEQVGRLARTMAEIYAEEPGLAQREAAAADRRTAQHDRNLRFAPGLDPATAPFGGVKAPTATPSTSPAVTVEQTVPRGLDR